MKSIFFNKRKIWYGFLFTSLLVSLSCSSESDPSDDDPNVPNDQVGEINGMVTDEDGNLYDNVRILLNEGTTLFRVVNTNENGMYTFTNVPVGGYNVEIELPLSTTASGAVSSQVSVQVNNTATVDFTIRANRVDAALVLGAADFLGEVRNAAGGVPTGSSELLYAVNVFTDPSTSVPILGPDGEHVTLGEWDNAEGSVEIYCSGETTVMEFSFSGLLPEGVYTLWVGPMSGNNILGTGALGDGSGTDNILDVSPLGNAEISVSMEPGSLSVFGTLSSCLLTNQTDIVLILDYHIDGQTHGASPGLDTSDVGHLLFFL